MSKLYLSLPHDCKTGEEISFIFSTSDVDEWEIKLEEGQQVDIATDNEIIRAYKSIKSTHKFDYIQLLYAADNSWVVRKSIGDFLFDDISIFKKDRVDV